MIESKNKGINFIKLILFLIYYC